MDPRKAARDEQKKIEDRQKSGNFPDKLQYLPKFKDDEERILRIICAKEALQWLVDHPDKNHDDYTEEVKDAIGYAWKDTSQHFNVGSGNAALSCLRQIAKPCPVCEAYEEDIKSDNEAIKKAASQIACKTKINFFVEWRGHEAEGPFIWSLADQWADIVMAKIANTDYTLIYDPFVGHDLKVTRHGLGMNNTRYDIDIRPDETFLYETVVIEDEEEMSDFDFEKGSKVLEVLPSIADFMEPVLNYEDYEAMDDQIQNDCPNTPPTKKDRDSPPTLRKKKGKHIQNLFS